jgi:hypothetical protein
MTRKYKISLIIYSCMLIFAILFNAVVFLASGHRIKFGIHQYLIPVYAILSIILLALFPKLENYRNLILITCLFFLGISLYFALQFMLMIFSGDFISEFIFFGLLFIGIFITSIVILAIEMLKIRKSTSH